MSTPPDISVASPTFHITVWFSVSVFASVVFAACLLEIEIVAKGTGKFVPVERVQLVQPEYDGKIVAINVGNGSVVKQGDLLIVLDAVEARAQVTAQAAKINKLRVEATRLNILQDMIRSSTTPNAQTVREALARFTAETNVYTAAHTVRQAELLDTELKELIEALSQIDARRETNLLTQNVLHANVRRIEDVLAIQQERMQISQSLLDRKSVSRTSFLHVFEEFTELQNEAEIAKRELLEKEAMLEIFAAERRQRIATLRNSVAKRLSEVEARRLELEQMQVASLRRLNSTEIRAPATGVVDQLSVFTVGGVVSQGDELMRIVPSSARLEFEARFSNRDVGFLTLGQHANIKLDAFPPERFGVVKGQITNISADAVEDDAGELRFFVRVTPESTVLSTAQGDFPLSAGMTAQLDAITGDRKLISYFFAPILRTVQDSLGER